MLEDHLAVGADPMTTILLQRSTSAAERMNRMLEHHLSAATSPPGRTSGVTDLNLVGRQLVADCGSVLQSMGATVDVEHLPVVRADPDEMYRILQNLVTNSIKFGRPNVPVHVRITARHVQDGWRIAVQRQRRRHPASTVAPTSSPCSAAPTPTSTGTASAWPPSPGSSRPTVVAAAPADSPEGGAEIWFSLPEV